MSYILDALRKSEQERRQTELVMAPASGENVKISSRRMFLWIGTITVVIAVFAVIAIWVYAGRSTTTTTVAALPVTPSASRPVELPVASPPKPLESIPPELKRHPLVEAPENKAVVRDLAKEAQIEPRVPKQSVKAVPPVKIVAPSANTRNSVKFLRAMSPDFQRSLPELVVNIHIYALREIDRILYINNRQYHAGDRVRDDVLVEEIVEDGAILSFRGERFKLPRPS